MTPDPERLQLARAMWIFAFVVVFVVFGMVAFIKTNPLATFGAFVVGVVIGYATAGESIK